MPRKARFLSSALDGQMVTVSASQGSTTRGPVTISAWAAAQDITVNVERFPMGNVLPGEVVIFYVTDVTGYTGDIDRDLDFEWDFDDAGSTFTVAQNLPNGDANVEFGRVVSKAYTLPGSKAPSVTIRDRTGVLAIVPLPITVDDPENDILWTKDLYVDFGEVSGAPDFSGVPPAGSGVFHIASLAEFEGITTTEADTTRVTFRRGETFSWGLNSVNLRGRSYVTSKNGFGSGGRPVLRPGTQIANDSKLSFFNPGSQGDASHFAVYEVDAEGYYDPVTGVHNPDLGWVNFCQTSDADSGVLYRSYCKVGATGLRELTSSSGTYRNTDGQETTFLGVHDVRSNNYSNYALAQWGSQCIVGISGLEAVLDPNALMRDDKDKVRNEATDHGPMRITVCEYLGVTNCNLAGSGGWTQAGADFALQPCLRILPVYSDTDLDGNNPPFTRTAYGTSVINIQRNRGTSGTFLSIGRNKDGDKGYMPRFKAVVDRNEFNFRRQHSGSFISASTSGIYARNNVVYLPNIYQRAGTQRARFMQLVQPKIADWTFEPGWESDPTVIAFNTIVSDRRGTYDRDVDLCELSSSWVGAAPTIENNLIEAPLQSNPVSTWSPVDRADVFKPVSGSLAIDAVSAGNVPVRDFGGNIRRPTLTNIGAHDVSNAVAGLLDAPINTAPPVIAELLNYPGEYHATSLGSWSNWPWFDQYMQEYEWRLNGTPLFYEHLQSTWNAGRLYWTADIDPNPPTDIDVQRGDTAAGVNAQASGSIRDVTGFANYSDVINPGLGGSFTGHFVWRAVATADRIGPVSLPHNSTSTVSLTASFGTWDITGNGDGTFTVIHRPFAGALTLVVTATNRSGQRVSAESAPLILP